MGASSDRKIVFDADAALRAASFDHPIRLRFEHSAAGEAPFHKYVDVHSELVNGIRVDIDEPITARDRAAVALMARAARLFADAPAAASEVVGKVIAAAWGEDIQNAIIECLFYGMDPEAIDFEAQAAEVQAGLFASLAQIDLMIGGE